jgi:hypothetical protein
VSRLRALFERINAVVCPRLSITDWSRDGARRAAASAVCRMALIVAVVAAAVQGFLHLLNLYVLDYASQLIDADKDVSLAGWFGTSATAGAAIGTAALGAIVSERRRACFVVAILLGYLSLDDMLVIHERLQPADNTLGPMGHAGRLVWPIVYLPLLALVTIILYGLFILAPRPIRLAAWGGLACLAVAVVLEATSPVLFALGFDHGRLVYETEVTVEEGLETGGWILIAFATIAACVAATPHSGRTPVTAPSTRTRREGG